VDSCVIRRLFLVAVVLGAGCLVGCPGGGNSSGGIDAGDTDVGEDGGADTDPDADPDADPDVDPDAPEPECMNEQLAFMIGEDTTWTKACSPYKVGLAVQVFDGATLTIEPGVEVQFATNAGVIQVGTGTDGGGLIARGTAEDPIMFGLSLEAEEGSRWAGITFDQYALAAEVTHATFTTCGKPPRQVEFEPDGACIALHDHPDDIAVLEDLTFNDVSAGVSLNGGRTQIERLAFDDATPVGLIVQAENMGDITQGFTYAGDTINVLDARVRRSTRASVTGTATWVAQAVPWHIVGNLAVTAPDGWVDGDDFPTVTLDAGFTANFERDADIVVGGSDRAGALITLGTEIAPVVLGIGDPEKYEGNFAISFQSGTRTSRLAGLVVDRGLAPGASGVCVVVGPGTVDGVDLSIVDTTLRGCGRAGVSTERSQLPFAFAEFDRNTFEDTAYGLWVKPDVLRTVTGNMTYDGVLQNALIGGPASRAAGQVTRPATWAAQGVPYKAIDSIEVNDDLILEPGLTISFDPARHLHVAEDAPASLVARGEDGVPVTFQASNGERGGWNGVVFFPGTRPSTNLSYVVVRDGGAISGNVYGGCVTVRGEETGPVSIVNTLIANCDQSALSAIHGGHPFLALAGTNLADSPAGLHFHPQVVGDLVVELGYQNVPYNLLNAGVVTDDATWIEQGVPWRATGTIEVEGPTLTLAEGVAIEFTKTRPNAGRIEVGVDAAGRLVAQGTPGNPVLIVSAEDAPQAGDWGGIHLGENIQAETSLVGMDFRHAGAGGRGVIQLRRTGPNVTIQAPSFTDTESPDITWDCLSDPTLLDIPPGANLDAPDCG
jgi:hypothetical protein